VISAAAAILGAAVSPVTTVFQSSRRAQQERQERQETARRQACIELLRAAVDLRALVANNHDYHGDEMAARVAQVRQYAADARVHAFNIALLAPRRLAHSAGELAAATGRVAVATAADTDLGMGVSVRAPDFARLDACIDDFTSQALDRGESLTQAS
jgi:Mn2+/Fe2+ NRAMP family transporter